MEKKKSCYKYEPFESLRTYRKLKGLSTRELAEISGVSQANIESLEYGKSNYLEIRLATLIKLCRALDIKAYDLYPTTKELKK